MLGADRDLAGGANNCDVLRADSGGRRTERLLDVTGGGIEHVGRAAVSNRFERAATDDEPIALGGERQGLGRWVAVTLDPQRLAVGDAPHPHRAIVVADRELAPVGRERDRVDRAGAVEYRAQPRRLQRDRERVDRLRRRRGPHPLSRERDRLLGIGAERRLSAGGERARVSELRLVARVRALDQREHRQRDRHRRDRQRAGDGDPLATIRGPARGDDEVPLDIGRRRASGGRTWQP